MPNLKRLPGHKSDFMVRVLASREQGSFLNHHLFQSQKNDCESFICIFQSKNADCLFNGTLVYLA